MYRVAIVEDEIEYQDMFGKYIERYATEKGERFSVDIFQDGFEITEGYSAEWDAILLDIRMKNQDGMITFCCAKDRSIGDIRRKSL